MSRPLRRIVHVDMDAFYASVEQRDRPELAGRPVAVGGSPTGRGVVCAASYEARTFGVRSAMAMARAVRLCPALVVVPPDFSKYQAVSQQVFQIFRSVTPLVEPLSLDEAYLDVTDNAWGETLGVNVARRLKETIRGAVSLTASAGVAPNKFLAKIASGWQKPDGLTVIAPDRVEAFLHRLPVDALWGVGPVTAAKLRQAGIERLVDVRTAPDGALQVAVGSQTSWLKELAWGRDERPVVPDRARKSVGSETTFGHDLIERAALDRELDALAGQVASWLDRHRQFARTITVKVRYADFTTVTRSRTSLEAISAAGAVAALARALLDRTDAGRRPVRLLGVSAHNLTDAPEPSKRPSPKPRLPFEAPRVG
ncbi:MAG: DNA polymerase IV [Vicinamibacterales bacterium]